MRFRRLLVATVLLAVAAPGFAHHVVWLDFGSFNLDSWSSVNGNNPPTSADVTAVRRQVIANMVEDYAPFDITFSSFQPNNGRYTRVQILGASAPGGLFGCAGPSCCQGSNCTGIGSWDTMNVSAAEVYSGSFASLSSVSGSNATTARIANAISHTASHELGHVLDLRHCNAADDSVSKGCSGITTSTADQNPNWHVMSSGSSWGLTGAQRATRDRFFSIHASRRLLYGQFQARNHFATLPNLNGGSGWSDLLYGRGVGSLQVRWYGRLSTSSAFGNYTTWNNHAGDPSDIFLTGDVNGDNRDDLVYGRFASASTTRWYVRLSTGTAFGNYTTWSYDAGDAGDIFRLADVNGDGRADLLYGRPLSSAQVRWYGRLSTGSSFGNYTTWSSDAGDEGDFFFLADVDADNDADLVYARTQSASQVTWYVRRSNGSVFGNYSTWVSDAGDQGDLFYVADTGGDGDADLNYARLFSQTQLKWYYRPSHPSQNRFGNYTVWSNDAGDAGDLPRLGDANGDGRVDLFYARNTGMTSLTATPNLGTVRWYGRLSQGGSFGNYTTWRSDAGDEGDIFP